MNVKAPTTANLMALLLNCFFVQSAHSFLLFRRGGLTPSWRANNMILLVLNESNQFCGKLTVLQPKELPRQVILVASNASNPDETPPISLDTGDLMVVAFLFGISCYHTAHLKSTQLKSTNKLMKKLMKKLVKTLKKKIK